ncbi:MAG: MarR family transcriptional regulator [Deltaproteobacteria bacterium]|nr:MarR family transcriptional regulator [Deltaproteobacteria bacterium]
MESQHMLEPLVHGLLKTLGRVAIPPEKIGKILSASVKHFDAYNLCDGTRSLTEVAKEARLDTGNLSRSIDRWVQSGILFRLGTGKKAKLLHLYPVSQMELKGLKSKE